MKRYIKSFALLVMLATGLSLASHAQLYVSARPNAPAEVRPLPPSSRHVWVGGGWTVRGGSYAYTNGYWTLPPRHHRHYHNGYWRHHRNGWVWVNGYWR